MNFDYMKNAPDFAQLYTYCCEAEEFALNKPNISVTSARKAMEYVVKLLYGAAIDDIRGKTVFEMATDYRFIQYVNDQILLNSIHYIRKMGNVAVHEGVLSVDEALKVLEELHFLVGEICILMQVAPDYPEFVKPTAQAASVAAPMSEPAVQAIKVEVAPELCAVYAKKLRNTIFNVKHGRDESENKKLFLQASLREAGWPMVNRANTNMPAVAAIDCKLDSGDTVDYVLCGRDNKPLAIIEYTTTVQNLIGGRTKGIDKANQLEKKCGYKPVVYYTNGYYIYCIDQLGYAPRRVFNFHSIEELELLKLRRTMRQDITDPVIDDAITNREYQKNAIRSMCKAFSDMRRRSLLVMATGTGKTRVSISCVDVLMKAGWIKNVLFLADRTSLVRQAHKNFNKLLPNVTTSLYTGGSFNRDANARIIFSTYQTMINLVNDDTREFGVGRFDLIIIDEAHRSIFKKYGALFNYFDSLMIGLTATPRCEENKSTYDKLVPGVKPKEKTPQERLAEFTHALQQMRTAGNYKTRFKQYLADHPEIDEAFIDQHIALFQPTELESIVMTMPLSEDFLDKYFASLDADRIARYQLFSEKFFIRHYAQMDAEIVLTKGKNDWRKKENRSSQLDVFLRLKGVKL